MDAFKGLHLIENVESRLVRMYSTLARRFSDDASAFLFFSDMKKDEQTHLKMAQMEVRMLRDAHLSHAEAVMDEAEMNKVLAIADRLIASDLPLDETLRLVYEIEHNAAELYVFTAIKKTDPKISALLGTMGETFRLHRAAVHDFLEAHGQHAEKLEENALDAGLAAPRSPTTSKESVLLINLPDQEELIVYAGALESMDYEVVNAKGIKEAESAFDEDRRFSIIFMDLESDEDENFALIPKIRSRPGYGAVPLIVLTTNYNKDFERRVRSRGASAMLHKMSTPPDKLKQLLWPETKK